MDAAPKCGRSTASALFMVDRFVAQAPLMVLPEDVGRYLVVLCASRDSCQRALELCRHLLSGVRGFHVVDVNQFFPLKAQGKPPQIALPPAAQPTVLVSTPASLLKLSGWLDQLGVWGVLYDECDLLRIYGGEEQLTEVHDWLQSGGKQRAL